MKAVVFCLGTFLLLQNLLYSQDSKTYSSIEVDSFPIFEDYPTSAPGTLEGFKDQLKQHVTKTFDYPKKALSSKLTGKAYVKFVMDSNGNIESVQCRSHEILFEKEAKRIIMALPKASPAILGGEAVAFTYSRPIQFNLIEGNSLKNVEYINPKVINSSNDLISYEDAPIKPVFLKCEKAKNQTECLVDQVLNHVSINTKLKPRKDQPLIVDVNLYFEIDKDSRIKNLVAISNNVEVKAAIEGYFNKYGVVVSPAKDSLGNPINSYFKQQTKMKSTARTIKRRP